MKSFVAALLAASVAYARTGTEKKPSQSEIEAAAASTEPHSPISNVKGLAFDRFVQVWLENIVCDLVRLV